MSSIVLNNVSLNYGDVHAVRDVSMEIPENCLFGLIGPDGSGKTTLFRMITTLLVPLAGTISVFGHDTVIDFKKIRKYTGYMPGRFSLYPDLTVMENLEFYATIFGTTVKRNYHLIEPVFSLLKPFSNRLSKNLSGGMKQKLALCCALIHHPRILVLDEPTTGVDAVSRKEFWEMLQVLKGGGMTILVSTPYMDEASQCDRIALMQRGVIMIENTPAEILAGFKPHLYEIKVPDKFKALNTLRKMNEIRRAYLFGQGIHLALSTNQYSKKDILDKLMVKGIDVIEIKPVKADFEDCFIDAVENNVV